MGETPHIKKSYNCSYFGCKATFSKPWKLEAHVCKHTGLKPFSCDSCDDSFCTRYQLTRHQLSHSGEKPYKCLDEGCAEAFVTHASMKNHMARVHEQQEKHYKCDHEGCGKEFNKRNKLNIHKSEHTQTLPFHCAVENCTKEFFTPSQLKRHGKVHAGYPCEEEGCPFQGKTWTEYQNHKKEHRMKLPCSDCKKQFANAWFLRMHQLHIHSGEKRVLTCPKKDCGKTFTKHFNLKSHVLGDHEGKKPFSCVSVGCGKSFAMKESLWRHAAVHDPTKKKMKKLHPEGNPPLRKSSSMSESKTSSAETSRLATRFRNASLGDGST